MLGLTLTWHWTTCMVYKIIRQNKRSKLILRIFSLLFFRGQWGVREWQALMVNLVERYLYFLYYQFVFSLQTKLFD